MSISKELRSHNANLSPEMALLGMLYERPWHGYELYQKVINDLGQIWRFSQSQGYAILKRLEKQGDIFAEEILQEKLPPRHLLHITPTGQRHFLDWLNTPCGSSARAIRTELITRLYFIQRYSPEYLSATFAQERLEVQAHIQRLQKQLGDPHPAQVFNQISLKLRVTQLLSVLTWLDETERTLCPRPAGVQE